MFKLVKYDKWVVGCVSLSFCFDLFTTFLQYLVNLTNNSVTLCNHTSTCKFWCSDLAFSVYGLEQDV